MFFSDFKSRWVDLTLLLICAFMAIALQVQTTILENGSYMGLRISLADLLLPMETQRQSAIQHEQNQDDVQMGTPH